MDCCKNIQDVQVVILAGGLGTHLRPITESIPKVMIEVNGNPFLEHQFNYLIRAGFKRFLLLVSYLGNVIENYFNDGSKYSIKIDYSYEKELMGTGGALKIANSKLDDSFILINGDTFYPLDYKDFMNSTSSIKDGGMIVVYDNREKIAVNNIKVEPDKAISKYSKKNYTSDMNGVDGGISFFSRDVLNLIPENKKLSLEEEIFPVLIKQRNLKAYFTDIRYYDIGTFERLEIIKNKNLFSKF